jgi:hypothetical protein
MAQRLKEPVQFRHEGVLFISDSGGDRAQSKSKLKRSGLRMLTYREAFSLSPEVIARLKGTWFYLDGKGLRKSGICTFDEKGNISRAARKAPPDRRVRVYKGKKPLSLDVCSSTEAGWRFALYANYDPDAIAPVVAGVRRDRHGGMKKLLAEARRGADAVRNDADATAA